MGWAPPPILDYFAGPRNLLYQHQSLQCGQIHLPLLGVRYIVLLYLLYRILFLLVILLCILQLSFWSPPPHLFPNPNNQVAPLFLRLRHLFPLFPLFPPFPLFHNLHFHHLLNLLPHLPHLHHHISLLRRRAPKKISRLHYLPCVPLHRS